MVKVTNAITMVGRLSKNKNEFSSEVDYKNVEASTMVETKLELKPEEPRV